VEGLMHKKYKKAYPFRLATTSFIYPAGYSDNVRRLAPWVDEIELLLFEGDHLPDSTEVDQLQKLAHEQDISYNVHLPMDICLGAVDTDQRHRSISVVAQTLERVAPLAATTHTLHLTVDDRVQTSADLSAWQSRCMESLEDLMQRTKIPSRCLSVETLDFNPQWLVDIVEPMDLAICIDVGHLLRFGYDLAWVIDLFQQRTAAYHLHGVAGGKDHLSLARLETDAANTLIPVLEHFCGTVSLEVFNHRHLMESLDALASLMSLTALKESPVGRSHAF
jgi:sugar phosphate isomerase/epimerase